MKKLVVLALLLAFQVAQAKSLETNEYSASVEGSVELLDTNGNTGVLTSGPAIIDVGRVNILTSPIEFYNGARKLTIEQGNKKFKFMIPARYAEEEGQVMVHRDHAKQLSHIFIKETRKFVKTYEMRGTDSCHYSGYCMTCSLGADGKSSCGLEFSSSCSGSQDVLYRVDDYLRNLQILIYTDSIGTPIQTEPVPEADKTILKELSSCG